MPRPSLDGAFGGSSGRRRVLVLWKFSRTRTKIDSLIHADCASARGVRAEPPGSTRGHVPDAKKKSARMTACSTNSGPRSLVVSSNEAAAPCVPIACTASRRPQAPPTAARSRPRAQHVPPSRPGIGARARRRPRATYGPAVAAPLSPSRPQGPPSGGRFYRPGGRARRIFFSVRHVSPRASRRLCAHPTDRSAICRN